MGGDGRAPVANSRAKAFDAAIETAFRQRLPVQVIVVDEAEHVGRQGSRASRVGARARDPVPWAVVEYDYESGRRLLVRGEKPGKAPLEVVDVELVGFEGETRKRFIAHRQREGWMRRAKIRDAMQKNRGRLLCEVRKCGFDFKEQYGSLGDGYAHVHHLMPLSRAPWRGREVRLSDLAIVCANCHAMIYLNGESRPLETPLLMLTNTRHRLGRRSTSVVW
jgi:5-methylcytosine-specific restriction protein A